MFCNLGYLGVNYQVDLLSNYMRFVVTVEAYKCTDIEEWFKVSLYIAIMTTSNEKFEWKGTISMIFCSGKEAD